jgi:molecular chaperone GrpE
MSAKDKIKKYEETEQAGVEEVLVSHGKDAGGEKEGAGDPEMDLQEEVKALRAKLTQAEDEAKGSYEKMLRVAAEFDNYKKRSVRELEEFRKYANEALIRELLTVVDNLERAIASVDEAQEHDACVLAGVKMTHQELLKILERYGVNPIHSVDQPFDPTFHQAVFQEETDQKPEHTVLKEMQRGYTLHDRLLRPAMVIVSKAAASSGGTEAAEAEPHTETTQDNSSLND